MIRAIKDRCPLIRHRNPVWSRKRGVALGLKQWDPKTFSLNPGPDFQYLHIVKCDQGQKKFLAVDPHLWGLT